MHMEVRALFGRFVWRGLTSMTSQSILPIHPSRGSRMKPTVKVCEHNWVAHASMVPDKGHLLEELGWMTCLAWKKQQKEEMKR